MIASGAISLNRLVILDSLVLVKLLKRKGCN